MLFGVVFIMAYLLKALMDDLILLSGMGCIKMYNSFIFVTDEFRGRVVKKTNNLEMFYNYIQSLPPQEEAKENTKKGDEGNGSQELFANEQSAGGNDKQ